MFAAQESYYQGGMSPALHTRVVNKPRRRTITTSYVTMYVPTSSPCRLVSFSPFRVKSTQVSPSRALPDLELDYLNSATIGRIYGASLDNYVMAKSKGTMTLYLVFLSPLF